MGADVGTGGGGLKAHKYAVGQGVAGRLQAARKIV
jgi:hypothetical protein